LSALSLVFAGLISLSAVPASADATIGQAPSDETVATVNGVKITRQTLDKIMQQGGQEQAESPEATRALLDKLIEVELVAQQAEKEGAADDPDFKFAMEMLKKQQLYVTEVRKKIIEGVKVTPEDEKAYYEKNKDKFQAGEEVKASHILVDAEEDAKSIKARLDKGEDFAAVAKEKSKCPSAPRGGDLGFFGKGRMVPEFEKAAFSLKVGEVSAPVKTQFGWHVIKVTERKEASVKTFDEVKDEIGQRLMQEKQKAAYDDLLAKLRAQSKVEINETALQEKKPAGAGAADGSKEGSEPEAIKKDKPEEGAGQAPAK